MYPKEGVFTGFQSSVRINVGPNEGRGVVDDLAEQFQSSVRINVGPNVVMTVLNVLKVKVSILRED